VEEIDVTQFVLGFLALSLSGYVVSHSAASIADAVGLSDTVLGVTVVSFATTLPENSLLLSVVLGDMVVSLLQVQRDAIFSFSRCA
jgi:Ca2+/Na+ antiporter